MRLTSRAAIAVIAFAVAPIAAFAEEPGNAQEGLVYAIKHCGECHAVEPTDEFSPNLDAPTFPTVANTPGITARALVVWLQTSHPTMPNLMIDPNDRDNVVAYILSLREQRH